MRRKKLLPRVARATKVSDGTRQKYFYTWRGGPLFKGENNEPLRPNDPQFVVAYL
ncbi:MULTISPECIES: hypothetical protein [unclassified Bradyrhizobium]|uniref:hypothetical protein n=1 Tax=unclassified Bradyrhizobium TaxID=2631580 RepID=UPI0004029C08|nr:MULTISPECIES: hypothetical protein [unclassified Bradyrhizobium]QIG92923.1 hypothetical protein G6P99_10680 [Bradyrhizobium sp. 6(2017)]